MCGICGIIDKDKFNKIEKNLIQGMNNVSLHRGPDGEGYYHYKNLAFGHRRLAIIDLTENGHQPMISSQYSITYNGEIYNYIEIKDELIDIGYKFKSQSDTEVILAAYDRWGNDCVKKFNGMWSFAIHDRKKGVIFCSRDRFGIKPFYYSTNSKYFCFASEIKQIIKINNNSVVNLQVASNYLVKGLEEYSEETFFKGIYKLMPSNNLIYDLNNNTFLIEKYYQLSESSKLEYNLETAVNKASYLLNSSVELRLRSDVKVGSCLSGGLDSSGICTIAEKLNRNNNSKKFSAIHAKSVETETDESFFAEVVKERLDLNLDIVEPSLNELSEVIDDVIITQEEPFGGPSIIMQYFVMKKSKEINCKVLLDGQGADEVFLGYERYHSYFLASMIKNLNFIGFFKYFKEIRCFKLSKLNITLRSFLIIFSGIFNILKNKRNQIRLKSGIKVNNKLDFNLNNLISYQITEITKNNLPSLLKYEDKNSMSQSIETRLPFLDYRLVEYLLKVDDKLKLKNGYLKFILRKILENSLPENIVWRTNKYGFEAPTNSWIKDNKDSMISMISSSYLINKFFVIGKFSKLNYNELWRLYCFSKWEHLYNVRVE
jgi:asparagine synthase (glutamine-hydrolysing)